MANMSPLTVAVLGLLQERPRHPYDIAFTLQRRRIDQQGRPSMGTLYHVMEYLQRLGCVEPAETTRDSRSPARVVYAITDEGRRQLAGRARELIAEPAHEWGSFEAGLSLLPQLRRNEAVALLRRRAAALREQIELCDYTLERLRSDGDGRLALIEWEMVQDARRAQAAWTQRLADDVEAGRLAWSAREPEDPQPPWRPPGTGAPAPAPPPSPLPAGGPTSDGAGGSPVVARSQANPWAVLVVLCLGFFMVLLDITIVNIAIPNLVDGLRASLDQVLWVLNAYTLTYAMLLITASRLGDRLGQRTLFALGLAVFTVASALCGLAQDPNQLIAARVLQAIGGALLTPQTLAILTSIFPPERRGAAFGVWGGIAGLAAIAGPVLGGLVVTYLDWRWVFYVNVPIGVVAFFAALLIVPNLRPRRAAGIEPVGVLLSSGALFLLTFGLIEGQRYDWGTIATVSGVPVTIPAILAAGAVLLGAFFAWDHFRASPLVPIAVFRDRNFSIMNWVGAAVSLAMVGLFLPLTIYLQSALGLSALNAGLALLPMWLVSMPVAPLAGRLADRIGGKYVLMAGLGLLAAGVAWMGWQADLDSTWLTFLPGLVVAGVGVGCNFAPLATVALRDVRPQLMGAASGVLNTTRQLGSAAGGAVVGAVLQNRLAVSLHDEAVRYSAGLPPQVPPAGRQRFVEAFSAAGSRGLEVGASTGSAAGHLGGLPPQVASRIAELSHQVFAHAFLDAMRPALLVPVAVLAVGALSCLAVRDRPRARTVPETRSRAAA
jgi:EmrB/QacA subfamily drug resistance transporter